MDNVFTVDVEDWYMTSDFGIQPDQWMFYEDRVEQNTVRILEMLDEFGVRGTFFVLGSVAQKHPALVRDIVARGHELASHGGWHRMLTTMTFDDIRDDLRFAKEVLEDVSGVPVRAFRAPSWSLSPALYPVLELLQEEGFTCDSSMQPFRTPLSGIRNAPEAPFHPVIDHRTLSLVEFPSTVARWGGVRVPFAGGLYLRILPIDFVIRSLRLVNRTRPGMIYIHPWELDRDQPRIAKSALTRFTHYHHLESTESKVARLLESFHFVPMEAVVAQASYPAVALS